MMIGYSVNYFEHMGYAEIVLSHHLCTIVIYDLKVHFIKNYVAFQILHTQCRIGKAALFLTKWSLIIVMTTRYLGHSLRHF